MSTAFAEEDLSMKKTEQRTGYGTNQVRQLRFVLTKTTFIFRKIEGYGELRKSCLPKRQKCIKMKAVHIFIEGLYK